MKIIEFIPHLKSGGGEKLVVDLSTAFKEKGHDCIILTLFTPSEDDLLFNQIPSSINKDNLGKHLGYDFKCFTKFLSYVRREKPDVVHLHLETIKYSLLAAILFRKCKYFATIHSEAKREAGTGIEKYVRKFLFGFGLVTPVTISKESELSFERFYGYKAKMIPNGSSPYIPTNVSSLLSKYRSNVDFLFVHAGRLHPVKNQRMLIDAIEQLHKEGSLCRLLILGRGEPGEVLDYVNAHESDTIIYVGEVPNVRDYFAISDCFCLSSHQEGLPITLLEAYSVGCPAITTPVGGCVNVVQPGKTGFLSKDNTLCEYVSSLRTFMSLSKREILEMRKHCIREFNEKYSIDKCAESYIRLFKE